MFAPRRSQDVARLIEREMLGLIVTCDDAGYIGTPLPLLPEVNHDDRIVALIGHFALANPHVDRLRQRPEALISFLGPHGAIPTAAVSSERWAPTWNYALAQFEVIVAFQPERTDAAVRALVAAVEGSDAAAWTPEQMGERYEQLLARVIAFRATVVRGSARFKLGQDEDRTTFGEIIKYLGNTPLSVAMRDQAAD